MKVLHVISQLTPGGAEKLLINILRQLKKTGHQPYVCTLFEKNPFESQLNELKIPFYALKIKHPFDYLRSFLSVRKIIKHHQIEIVHTHLFHADLLGRLAAKSAGVKNIVTTLHSPGCTYECGSKSLFRIKMLADKITGKWNQSFIAVSGPVKKDFESKTMFNPIHLIHNGLDPKAFKASQKLNTFEAKAKLGFSKDEFVFSNIARLCAQKGQQDLLEAFQRINKQYRNTHLLLLGRGPDKLKLQKRASQLNLDPRHIHFMGWVDEIAPTLKATDVFVFPSLYEGFGMGIIEAMYMKCPVIAYNTGGPSEIIQHQKTGILVPPGHIDTLSEQMLRLMKDQNLRHQLACAGHQNVNANYLISHCVQKIGNIYKQMT
jgi:L-malate glycosyltransferase